MSTTLKKAKYFILLLLDKNTSKYQSRALLETASGDQVNALSEIFYNLQQGGLPLSPILKDTLKKRQRVLSKLGNKKISVKERSCIVQQHTRIVHDTLLLSGPLLIKVLKE